MTWVRLIILNSHLLKLFRDIEIYYFFVDVGQVVSSLNVSQLRNILMTPLRSTEKAIIKSIETPITTFKDTQVQIIHHSTLHL